MKIIANGILDGKKLKVSYENGLFRFDDKPNILFSAEIRAEMEMRHPIGGTYRIEDVNDPLNIMEVLRNWFFDRPTLDIKTDAEIPDLPNEKGVVY